MVDIIKYDENSKIQQNVVQDFELIEKMKLKYETVVTAVPTIEDINAINMKIVDINEILDHTDKDIHMMADNVLKYNEDLNDRVTCVNKAMTDLILRNRKMEKELFILRILSIASYILVLALIIASMM